MSTEFWGELAKPWPKFIHVKSLSPMWKECKIRTFVVVFPWPVCVELGLLLPEQASGGFGRRLHWQHYKRVCELILQCNAFPLCFRWAGLSCNNNSISLHAAALMWQFMWAAVPACTAVLRADRTPSSHCLHMQIIPRSIQDFLNSELQSPSAQ